MCFNVYDQKKIMLTVFYTNPPNEPQALGTNVIKNIAKKKKKRAKKSR